MNLLIPFVSGNRTSTRVRAILNANDNFGIRNLSKYEFRNRYECCSCTCEQPDKKEPPTTLLPHYGNSTGCECTTINTTAVQKGWPFEHLYPRYICAKGQDTQVSAAAVLIKDKPIPNVFQYRTNCLNATPMFEYRATSSQQT